MVRGDEPRAIILRELRNLLGLLRALSEGHIGLIERYFSLHYWVVGTMPELDRRDAEHLMEHGSQMALATEAQAQGNVGNPGVGMAQRVAGALDSHPQQILVRRQPRQVSKALVELGWAQARFRR